MIKVYKPLFGKKYARITKMRGSAPELMAELGCAMRDIFERDCERFGKETALQALELMVKLATGQLDAEGDAE